MSADMAVTQAGEQPSTNSLYDSSSFIIGGFLGLVAGPFPCLTAPGSVLENKVTFWILDKITSAFLCSSFFIILAIMSPLHLIVKTSIGPMHLRPTFFAALAFLPTGAGAVLLSWMAALLRRLAGSGARPS